MIAPSFAITNARLFDPAQKLDELGDLVVENGRIKAIGEIN